MAKKKWAEITREDVINAIRMFELENPTYPEPRSTFLLYEGKKYPAKHVRGMAYQIHFGEEILKSEYSGGGETVRFFEKLGFETQYTHKSVNTHPIKKARLVSECETEIKTLFPVVTKTNSGLEVSKFDKKQISKIKIPVKGVIEQKNALQLLLNRICDGDIVCEKTFSWMKTPVEIKGEYKKLYDSLVSYRGNKDFAKKSVTLRCDFVCESKKLIIEYDERQHFSEARRISLLSYPDVKVFYDLDLWCKACNDIQAKDNQPVNRDEIRAYYDSVRDIEAAKNGYKLVRIMHGQIDFNEQEALEKLKEILDINDNGMNNFVLDKIVQEKKNEGKDPLKIGLYLQTDDSINPRKFHKAMDVVRKSDIDILVFPEFSYVTGMTSQLQSVDYLKTGKMETLIKKVLEFSKEIGKAVVLGNKDAEGRIISIFANAMASESETTYKTYFKHTMTGFSAFDFDDYPKMAQELFKPILFKGYRIGLTICYDCNHALFSRKYYQTGVDIILNSTGGDVKFDKWHKYNKARAIENECFTFVTMGGPSWAGNMNNYVYGFTPTGKEMEPILLNGTYDGQRNVSGGIYVYDTLEYDGTFDTDVSNSQKETINQKSNYSISLSEIKQLTQKGKYVTPNIRVLPHGKENIIFCFVDERDIMKPEKVLELLYEKQLRQFPNKRYIIVNRWDYIDMDFYESQLAVILKVRSMENFCAVVLSSSNITKCFQCGMNRTAQVVKEMDGEFGLDLSRTGGPETIWKNKLGMKAS